MVKMEKRPKKVKFIHNMPKDYRIYPANGVFGGMTARGDLVMNFFVEHHVIPPEQVQKVKADGSLAPIKTEQQEELEVSRVFQMGVMVNREQALDIAKWIMEKVKQYDKIATKKGE